MIHLEGIKALVQILVVIIVLAVFIEMLLPNTKMHDYVKMVMGLMVIVVVLEAGASMVNQDFKFDLPAMTSDSGATAPGLERIMDQGQKMAEGQKQRAMEEYRNGLEKQILALARLQKDLNVTGATITTSANGDRDIGRLTGIVLEVSPEKQEENSNISKVKPVDITVGASGLAGGDKAKNPHLSSSQAKELVKTVANFYNIPEDQVKIVEAKR